MDNAQMEGGLKGTMFREIAVIAAIIAATVGMILVIRHLNPKDPGSAAASYKIVDACTVFTASDAAAAIGNVEASQTNDAAGPIMANGIRLSNCGYAHGTENVNDIITVNVQVRSPVNHDGAAINQNEFSALEASGLQPVSGYGDAAYWNPAQSELDIMAGDNWYAVGNVKGGVPGSGTLDISKKVANRLKHKL